jgi:hypothetical protein
VVGLHNSGSAIVVVHNLGLVGAIMIGTDLIPAVGSFPESKFLACTI